MSVCVCVSRNVIISVQWLIKTFKYPQPVQCSHDLNRVRVSKLISLTIKGCVSVLSCYFIISVQWLIKTFKYLQPGQWYWFIYLDNCLCVFVLFRSLLFRYHLINFCFQISKGWSQAGTGCLCLGLVGLPLYWFNFGKNFMCKIWVHQREKQPGGCFESRV